jgi:hypothetical protein
VTDRDATASPRLVSASHGIAWLMQSLSLLRLQAGRLLLIGVLMQLILGLSQVPLISLLVIISVPGLTAGLLEAFHVTARGGAPDIRLLFRPLTSSAHSGRLFAIGALIFAVGVLSISLLLSGNQLALDPALMERIEQGDIDAVASLNQETLARMAMALLVGVAVSGTLSYFTIPLIWFGSSKIGPALVVGLKGLVLNWRPFLLLGLGLLLVLSLLGIVGAFLFSLTGSGGGLSLLIMGLILLLVMLFQLLLFGTQYCAYRDIFGFEEPPAAAPPDNDSQLLA